MRWPLMTKARYEREMLTLTESYQAQLYAAQQMIDREYTRATKDGRTKVRDWARNACSNVFHSASPAGAAQAAFQSAEAVFSPEPLSFTEFLSQPHHVQEVLANAIPASAP